MITNETKVKKILTDACRITRAGWAIWLGRSEYEWIFSVHYALRKSRYKALKDYLSQQKTAIWLAGALSANRIRWRNTGLYSKILGCQRIYAFPNPDLHHILLVGSNALSSDDQGLFRILSSNFSPDIGSGIQTEDRSYEGAPLWPFDTGLEASYDPQQSLKNILELLTSGLPCDAAYIAIRSGEVLVIQATLNCLPEIQGYEISIQDDRAITQIISNHKGIIIKDACLEQQFVLTRVTSELVHGWMGVPILIGQRVIGITGFSSTQIGVFNDIQLQQTTLRVERLAYNVENAIIFNEVTRYLQQLALLNDLASTAALGVEADSTNQADEFARRVMIRLRRVFETDWAAILVNSSDGKYLQELGGGSSTGPPWRVPIKKSLMGLAFETGMPIRIGDLRKAQRFYPIRPNLCSELAVPLKYRGKLIGVLVLVSEEPNAFSSQDEQLLIVIASHMAGLFDNVRLNEEMRERASKLADSVRQLQAVRDTSLDITGDLEITTLLKRVANRARDLVGARGAELGLFIPEEGVVRIVVSETPWENMTSNNIPLMAGVAGRIAAFGEPIVVADYNKWQGRLLPDDQAIFKTVAGVPLKFKGDVIGTLTVLDDRPEKEFKEDDVKLLELIAPQAAISIRNAGLYQELQERIKAQQLAETRLIRSARLAAVGEMAAGIAHELNNPLTTVTGFVELALSELPNDSPIRSDLDLVLEEAYRARGVVRRLLDFSRPVDDQRIKTDVNELIEQVLPLVSHLASTGGISINTELQSSLPWILLDPNQIKQVLLNIIHNAFYAMPKGGKLSIKTMIKLHEQAYENPDAQQTVKKHLFDETDSSTVDHEAHSNTTRSNEWISIAITDTGEGILPENLERIFDPFFSTRPSGKGTGLGLSVSYGIISSHNGFIEVASQINQGSCFTIYLPINYPTQDE